MLTLVAILIAFTLGYARGRQVRFGALRRVADRERSLGIFKGIRAVGR